MSGTGYEVDLDYLKSTIGKLQSVVDGMDGACTKVDYNTVLTRKQLGSDTFLEAGTLYGAHESMKTQISAMIKTLQTMVQEFTNKTAAVHSAYTDQETTTSGHFAS